MAKRPCENLHIPLMPDTCSYCWRAIHVRSYQRLWRLPITGEYETYDKDGNHVLASQTIAPQPLQSQDVRKLYNLPCINEGNILEYCNTCNGESRHVRECDIHEKCTRGFVSNKVRSCVKCAVEPNTPYRTEQDIEKEKKQEQQRSNIMESNESQAQEPVIRNSLIKPNQSANRMQVHDHRTLLKEKANEVKINHQEITRLRKDNKDVLTRAKLKGADLEWTCGITTVPARRITTLPKTIESIINAGFPIPQLFIDAQPNGDGSYIYSPDLLKEYATDFPFMDVTLHTKNIRTFGNWYLALLELYIRNPKADRFVLFQDDIILSKNVREYMEHCDYPERGYMNLITYPQNEAERAKYQPSLLKERGWYRSNQMGKGAQALVFNREALLELMSNEYIHRRLQDDKGWQGVDGGVSTALKLKGYIEYVHSPSLVRHTGTETTMGGPTEHPQQQPPDLSFRGENWDALEMIKDME